MDAILQTENCTHKWRWVDKDKHRVCSKCGLNQRGNTIKQKSDAAIPQRFVISMLDNSWLLRNTIIWKKTNAMPSSVKDRFTIDFDYIFFFVKAKKYWFKQQLEPYAAITLKEKSYHGQATKDYASAKAQNPSDTKRRVIESIRKGKGRNKRCVWEIKPKGFKEAHFACVTPDTEILTIDGWKKYTDFKWYSASPQHIKVATYNLQTQKIEYQPLSYICEYDYDGELVHVGNRDLDILMTPNHRNVVIRWGGEECIKEASELNSRDCIKTLAPIDYPVSYNIGETLAELVGWVLSEGHYKKGGYIELYQNEGDKAERIDMLLQKLEIPHTRNVRGREYEGTTRQQVTWFLKRSPLVEWILQNIPNKTLTKQLASLPIPESQALFNGLVGGDGCVRKDDESLSFIQKDKKTCDWFEIIALRLGYHTTTRKRKDNDIFTVYCTRKEKIGVRGTNGSGTTISNVYYKGKVWCPRTPNGTWIAKRNGSVFITGNTFPEKLVEPMILAGCPSDGLVLDPFVGSGTTALTARRLGRHYIGIDISELYCNMSRKRLSEVL